jgi:hypothetical protein
LSIDQPVDARHHHAQTLALAYLIADPGAAEDRGRLNANGFKRGLDFAGHNARDAGVRHKQEGVA